MITRLLLAIVIGHATHQLAWPVSLRFHSERWASLFRNAAGVLAAFPFALAIYKLFGGRDDDKFTAAYFLGFGGIATGSFAGHLQDWMSDER